MISAETKFDLSNTLPMLGFCMHSRDYKTMGKPLLPSVQGASKAIIGLEVEVEGITDAFYGGQEFWNVVTDGSLRNHGREFISLPLRSWEVAPALDVLDDLMARSVAESGMAPDFSWRTSTHIHLNVRDMHLYQVGTIGLLEILFSRLLFNFIKHDREKSNFCIPNITRRRARNTIRQALADHPYCQDLFKMPTDLCDPSTIRDMFLGSAREFSKYSSLNFLPALKIGTLEFRHFHGCDDREKLNIWIDVITRLHDYVTAEEFNLPVLIENVRRLNTRSNYTELTREVFGERLGHILMQCSEGGLDDFLKTGCFKVKQTLFDNPSIRITRARTAFVGAKKFFASRKEAPSAKTRKFADSFSFSEVYSTPTPNSRMVVVDDIVNESFPYHNGLDSTSDDPESYSSEEIMTAPENEVCQVFKNFFAGPSWRMSSATGRLRVASADPVDEPAGRLLSKKELWILRRQARMRQSAWNDDTILTNSRIYPKCPFWNWARSRLLERILGEHGNAALPSRDRINLASTYRLLSMELDKVRSLVRNGHTSILNYPFSTTNAVQRFHIDFRLQDFENLVAW